MWEWCLLALFPVKHVAVIHDVEEPVQFFDIELDNFLVCKSKEQFHPQVFTYKQRMKFDFQISGLCYIIVLHQENKKMQKYQCEFRKPICREELCFKAMRPIWFNQYANFVATGTWNLAAATHWTLLSSYLTCVRLGCLCLAILTGLTV